MNDQFEYLMKRSPDLEFGNNPIPSIDLQFLEPFSRNGVFTKSFDVSVTGSDFLKEIWILSSVAYYVSNNGSFPMVQIRLIDSDGSTLYYAPPYIIGHTREYYRREWRVPPIIDRYDTVRLSFIIPEGVTLYIKEIKSKANTRTRENGIGIRYHGHAGFPGYAPSNTAFSFQMASEMGFSSCITIPKFTKDGIGVCFHDDSSIRKIVRYNDGSEVLEGSPDDTKISDFTYEELMKFDVGVRKSNIYKGTRIPTMEEFFSICSQTGMQPIFSVHPDLTYDQWLYVRDLLEKYRLLEHFWVKSGRSSTQKITREIFDDEIAGYILIQGINSTWDPLTTANKCGLDLTRHKVVMEYFYLGLTEEKIKLALDEGFTHISAATTKGGFSGPGIQKLIDMGISEFTLDHHCSMGLSW